MSPASFKVLFSRNLTSPDVYSGAQNVGNANKARRVSPAAAAATSATAAPAKGIGRTQLSSSDAITYLTSTVRVFAFTKVLDVAALEVALAETVADLPFLAGR